MQRKDFQPLRECPFCGGEADIEEIPGSPFTNEPYTWAVGCKACNIGWYEETQAEATSKWNRRTQPENEPIVRCKDCVWWKGRQVQLADGTCRDYLPDEPWSVTIDVGINVAEHCTKHGFEDKSGSWFWATAEDFCSRGERKPERSEG